VLYEPKGLFPEHEDLHEQPLFYVEPKDKLPDSEDKRQRQVVAECRRLGLFVAHIPQSGRRSDYERTRLHRNGAIAGIPDLYIAWARGQYWAEMKDGKGAPSRQQIDVMNDFARRNIPCGVHRGWASLEACLIAAGAPITRTKAETPVGDAARNVILRLIEIEQDPSERKAKIMIAREDGHLSDAETEAWITRDGLRFA
jgi:VRR-NUC domain.